MKRFKKLITTVLCLFMITIIVPTQNRAEISKINDSTIILDGNMDNKDFKEFLLATDNSNVKSYKFILHSGGGDAYSCLAVMSRMRQLQKQGITFHTEIYGIGMSAATYIFLMGDTRTVHEGSSLMFHSLVTQVPDWIKKSEDPYNIKFLNLLRRMDLCIEKLLRIKTNMSESAIKWWLNSGKIQFMSPETALNVGVATHYISAD